MSATTIIHCNGERCTRRAEVPCEESTHTTNERLRGWITRFFQDRIWLPTGEKGHTSVLHYCPECALVLSPPLCPPMEADVRQVIATPAPSSALS